MDANDCRIGQKFRHKNGSTIEVIEMFGTKMFDIDNIGTFSYIDDDFILCEI